MVCAMNQAIESKPDSKSTVDDYDVPPEISNDIQDKEEKINMASKPNQEQYIKDGDMDQTDNIEIQQETAKYIADIYNNPYNGSLYRTSPPLKGED